jgi:molecular chaperone GrpE
MSEPYGARAGAPDDAPADVPEKGARTPGSGDEERPESPGTEDQVTEEAEADAGASPTGQGQDDRFVALAAQRDEYLDALRRLQADFENYRKRILRQQTELLERAAFDLVGKLLPILDTIDLALAHAEGDPSTNGLTQVATTARDALSREGLERLDPVGQPFDPALHEAVAHEEAGDESDKPQVSEVLRPGYRWKGQLLRPAMVKVTG